VGNIPRSRHGLTLPDSKPLCKFAPVHTFVKPITANSFLIVSFSDFCTFQVLILAGLERDSLFGVMRQVELKNGSSRICILRKMTFVRPGNGFPNVILSLISFFLGVPLYKINRNVSQKTCKNIQQGHHRVEHSISKTRQG
jgi:hypothetical protein